MKKSKKKFEVFFRGGTIRKYLRQIDEDQDQTVPS